MDTESADGKDIGKILMAENENSESAIGLCRMAMLISPCKMSATCGYGFSYSQNGHGTCVWVY
jgi:hypothetical protein